MYQKSPESHQQILQVIFFTISVYLSISMSVTSSTTLSTSMTSTPITTSNIISMSIINHQSLIGKVFSRYLHSPGSHKSTRFLESLTQWLTHSLTLSLLERLVTLKKNRCFIDHRGIYWSDKICKFINHKVPITKNRYQIMHCMLVSSMHRSTDKISCVK